MKTKTITWIIQHNRGAHPTGPVWVEVGRYTYPAGVAVTKTSLGIGYGYRAIKDTTE